MKRLLIINSALNYGSTGKIAENIGLLAKKNDWEVCIAHGLRYCLKSNLNSIKVSTKFEEYIHAIIHSMLLDRHGFGSKKATKKLIEKIKEFNPDLIHLHNLHGYFINVKVLFEFLSTTNIPVVWTLHDCWSFTGHCSHFSFIGCEKWKSLCNNCPQKFSYPKSFFLDNSKKNYTEKSKLFTSIKNMMIVPVSYWLEELLKDSFLKKYPTKTIHNGINLNIFKPSINYEKKLSMDKFIILGVASPWSRHKGLDDFIKISQYLENDCLIILIGLNKRQIKSLPKNIIGLKKTSNVHELVNYYSMSNVFVNPTYEDTFPTTNIEALACGTPVITYETGGSPESIDNSTGIVVDKGNIEGLINAINTIKTNKKEFYSKECVQRANKLFNKENKFLEYIDLYEFLFKN